jgi:hypothetical protein
MQLYEVWFQLHFANVIDIGRAIVCAQDQTKAKETVIAELDLPVAALRQCDVKRVKPNLFLLERKEITKPPESERSPDPIPDKRAAQKGLRARANTLAENREYRREMTEYLAQQRWAMEMYGGAADTEFECRMLAHVLASDENEALLRLAAVLRNRGNGVIDNGRYVKKILVDLVPDHDRGMTKRSW